MEAINRLASLGFSKH